LKRAFIQILKRGDPCGEEQCSLGEGVFLLLRLKKRKKERKKKTEGKSRRKKRTVLKIRHYNGRIPEELIRVIA
jgi:hypothetical protein